MRQFPWNNAVILSGIDWDWEKREEKENKYAPAHTVDSIGRNATVCIFKLRKNLTSERGLVIRDSLHATSQLHPLFP